MANLFLTGASGYIGGDILHLLAESRPEYRVRALIRDAAKAGAVKNAFGQVEVVNGSLDDIDLIAQDAQDADVVLHLAATGHLKSVQAIHKALADKPKGGKSPYWIQIGGGSVLAAAELADKSRVSGTGSDTVFDNLAGIEAIRSLIKQHPSRAADNYMLSVAETTPHVKTAIVPAPMIYGQGRGPGNRRSVQIPELAKVTLERRRGLRLARASAGGVEGDEDGRVWGSNEIYLAAAGEMSFGEISQRVTDRAYDLKLLPRRDVDQVGGEEADKLLPHGSVLFGTNARGRPSREEAVLGWRPQEGPWSKRSLEWWLTKHGHFAFCEVKGHLRRSECWSAVLAVPIKGL
ncbi:hypothetical protein VUR80DRAFT_387 [Thermomyces stellatus]